MEQVIIRLGGANNEFIRIQSDRVHDLHLATSVLMRCGMISGMYMDEQAIRDMGFVPNVIDTRIVDFSDTIEEWNEDEQYSNPDNEDDE